MSNRKKSKSTPVPPFIKVGPYIISVVEEHNEVNDQHKWGDFNYHMLRIRIEKNVPEMLKLDTLTHEIMHAVHWVYNIKEGDDEERTVAAFATGMTQV